MSKTSRKALGVLGVGFVFAICVFPGPAAAQHSVNIDATRLTATTFNVDFGSTLSTAAMQNLNLATGNHTFCANASSNCFVFEVTVTGGLSFLPNPSASLFAEIDGSTLQVNGYDITFNLTSLDTVRFNIDIAYPLSPPSTTIAHTFSLMPSTENPNPFPHFLCADASGQCFLFDVDLNGTVQFDPALDGMVSGRSTDTLTVNGVTISVDTLDLTPTTYNINFNNVGDNGSPSHFSTGDIRQFTVLPNDLVPETVRPQSNYILCSPASTDCLTFKVTSDGNVTFDPENAICLDGAGTPTLDVDCIVVDDPEGLIAALRQLIAGLDPVVLKNQNEKLLNALDNKLGAVLSLIVAARSESDPYMRIELLQEAVSKLENDLLKKTDGCSLTGSPQGNDWIVDCGTQATVSEAILDVIAAVELLI